MSRRKYPTHGGTIYTGRRSHRRVVESFEHPEFGTRIVYSDGGARLRECGYVTFRRWIRAGRAKRVVAPNRPRLALSRQSA